MCGGTKISTRMHHHPGCDCVWQEAGVDPQALALHSRTQVCDPHLPVVPRYSLLAVFAATDGGITRVFPNK